MLQSVAPWFSPEDVDKGSRWLSELSGQLSRHSFAVLCVTSENMTAPWLIFEAGALSKAIESSSVCPLLLGIEPASLQGPLAQFQATKTTKEDVRRLIATINRCQTSPLPDAQFDTLFEVLWPRLEASISAIKPSEAGVSRSRPVPEVLSEVLERVRAMERKMTLSSLGMSQRLGARDYRDVHRRLAMARTRTNAARRRYVEFAQKVRTALEAVRSDDPAVTSAAEEASTIIAESEAEVQTIEQLLEKLRRGSEPKVPDTTPEA
jgi:hypothetical protein